MTTGLLLAIVGALVAFGWGIWLGLPGRYTQTPEDIARNMESGTDTPNRKRLAKRSVNPLAWLQRSVKRRPSSSRKARSSRASRGGFKLEPPDE